MEEKHKINCTFSRTPSFGIVIFGASGDLAYNKLFPSLFGLFKKGILDNRFFILGVGRTEYDDSSFRKRVESSIKSKFNDADYKLIGDFCINSYYIKGAYDDVNLYKEIKQRMESLFNCYKIPENIIYNLAVPPILFETIFTELIHTSLLKRQQNEETFQRLMIEKPFGVDFESAVRLNNIILKHINDSQVFRIDHYLGKDTVQNILVFRFANSIFDELFNYKYIDHVQIKFEETKGIENRGAYFDKIGMIRDVFQNHILQLIALVAMERPGAFDTQEIKKQKLNLFKSILLPLDVRDTFHNIILGQYEGYRQEKNVSPDSCTETFFATKVFIDNNRWRGVPFYILAGKKLDEDESKITIVFKKNKKCIFCMQEHETNNNALIFKIKPKQGVSLKFLAKAPGGKMCISPFFMDFNYQDLFKNEIAEDYESIILECINGDSIIFWDKDCVEVAWAILSPLINKLQNCTIEEKDSHLHIYSPKSKGPKEFYEFFKNEKINWI